MASSDDDRISYLTGEQVDSLTPAERAELDDLDALLKSPATWAEPHPGLGDRVSAAIAAEAGTRPARAPAHAARRHPRARLWRPSFALPPALAAVAAAAVAIAIAVGNGNGGASPQRFAMVVAGTALAPGAHGSATLTKTPSGWRIELRASGLPRLANGRYYEAWLKNPAGVLVPVGTFNDARQVTLWAGVPPTAFPSLSVTRQLLGAGAAPSGVRVLGGTITASH